MNLFIFFTFNIYAYIAGGLFNCRLVLSLIQYKTDHTGFLVFHVSNLCLESLSLCPRIRMIG